MCQIILFVKGLNFDLEGGENMKKLLTIMMALALIAGAGVMKAEAADTATISITVTIASIDVTLTPGWAIGAVVAGSTQTTWTDTTAVGDGNFTATNENTSNTAVDLTIETGNSVGDPPIWTPTPEGSANGLADVVNEFELYQGQTATVGVDPCTDYVPGTVPLTTLTTGLAVGSSYKFDLKLILPRSGSGTAAQSITVQIRASIA